MHDRLKRLVEDVDSRSGRAFSVAVQTLIILSLISFSIETLPSLSRGFRDILSLVESITVLLFSVEYALRIYVADSKLGYVFSFFGIVDLAAILPYYLMLGIDLRSIRVLRILRLFRILKFARYNEAIRRFHLAARLAKEEIILFLSVALILIYVASVGIYYFEGAAQPEHFGSIFLSMWWAVVTLTTVGYGDAYPITLGGRVFTFFILIIGLGVVAVPAGLFASSLSKAREIEEAEIRQSEGPKDEVDPHT
jgi:voltage-gated potassium channel